MKTIIISAVFVFLAGCATMAVESTGVEIKEQPSKTIKVGKTTKDEVLKTYGNPTKSSEKDGTEVLTYEFQKTETPTYFKGKVVSKANATTTFMKMDITLKKGIVQEYTYEAKKE